MDPNMRKPKKNNESLQKNPRKNIEFEQAKGIQMGKRITNKKKHAGKKKSQKSVRREQGRRKLGKQRSKKERGGDLAAQG